MPVACDRTQERLKIIFFWIPLSCLNYKQRTEPPAISRFSLISFSLSLVFCFYYVKTVLKYKMLLENQEKDK